MNSLPNSQYTDERPSAPVEDSRPATAAGDPVTRAAALAALGDAENFGDSK